MKGGDGRGYWPPRWLSAGFSLEKNQPISLGLTGFLKATLDSQKTQEAGFEHIKKIRGELRALSQAEDDLAKASTQAGASTDAVDAVVGAYLRQKTRLDQSITEAGQSGLFPPGPIQLFASYKQLVEDARKQSETAFKQLQSEIDRFAGSVQDNPTETPFTLTTEIRRKMIGVQQQIKVQAEGMFPADELTELQALDRRFLEKTASGDPLFVARAEVYQLALLQTRDPAGQSPALIGSFSRQLEQLRTGVAAAKGKADRYQGAYSTEAATVVRWLLEVAQTRWLESLYDRYLGEVEGVLRRSAGFPLLSDSVRSMAVADVKALDTTLRSARADLPAIRSGPPPARLASAIDLLESRVQRLSAISEALLNDDGRPANVTLTLLNYNDQRQKLGRKLGVEEFAPKFVGSFWRMLRVNNRSVRTEARANEELAHLNAADAALTIDFFRNVEDAEPNRSYAFKADWAVLRLLQQSSACRLPGGKEWEITLAQKDEAGTERFLILVLQFEKPLPEIEQWPTASRLGL